MKNIAIIGSGISGMTAAYLLSKVPNHNVTVFEKNDYVGGHTATVDVEVDGQMHAIDTGFIVFNDRTYPKFEKLLSEIGISRQPTQMSFSVQNTQSEFEYNGHTFTSLFAQRRNIFRPTFWRLLYDIVRFNKLCKQLFYGNDYSRYSTLGALLTQHNFNEFFKTHYILPMGAAIWSTSIAKMSEFEAQFFVKFFFNHGLLDIANRPQWYVIPGGSRSYITPLIESFKNAIHLNANIKTVRRNEGGVELVMEDGRVQLFDEIVFACHSDQALALLEAPTEDEAQILGSMAYTENSVLLHTDKSMLPKRHAAWASWNYLLDGNADAAAVVTYQMNILQGIESEQPLCVTLNYDKGIDDSKVLRRFTYHHPVFNQTSIDAQKKKALIDGKHNSYFCGAYWFNGFHEDGVKSAVDVARQFGVEF
ncbi:NAD(P)/FAD-dependent oxidoreductase [Pseudoalteromonas sp. MMG012]|uniref:NAD(P)/FAD-dependent oxidoreductase n=1 Tax=Pseudoalteromonas sp. MMG012 TaxID=2822686 RepID=UPI001B39E1FE|nr:FAD-dependent oxidoreductase [Pseudoalteromonas sp. MMG012]MBQ4849705.1 FAD-dependent oxidoreductase [Pseudoalteromonas sp. MMG012]